MSKKKVEQRKLKMKTIYLVLWLDPTSHMMVEKGNEANLSLCASVGQVRKKNEKEIEIVSSWYPDGTNDVTVINLASVIKKYVLFDDKIIVPKKYWKYLI